MGNFPGHQSAKLRGFSLLEVLVTLAVLALAMVLVSSLATQYLRVAAEGAKRNQGSLVLRALQSVLDEAGSAVEILAPVNVNESTSELAFRKRDPVAVRFPTPAPTPFIPLVDSELVGVRYFLEDGVLKRSLLSPTGGTPMAVLEGLKGMSAVRLSGREVEVSLSYEEAQGQLQVVRGRVFLWSEKISP